MPKKMNKREALIGASQTRKAQVSKTQVNDYSLTFVMVSENNDGERFDWDNYTTYIERLDISGANMQSLNTFFKNHNRSVDDAIGRIENARKEGTSLLCEVVFDESGADVKRKYQNGTLSDVSIGYRINKYTVEERKGEPDIVTVTDFDITELSAVGIGFDSGATYQGREAQTKKGERMLEELMARLATLEKNSKRTDEENKELQKVRKDIEEERAKEVAALQAEKKELKRKAELMAIARAYKVSDEMLARFEEKGTAQDLMKATLDERIAKQIDFHARPSDNSSRENMIAAMTDAIALKSGVRVDSPHADANMFRGASMIDIAKQVTGVSGYDRNEIASRAMVSADFPMLLVNAGNRILEQGYATQTPSFEAWVKQVELPDFKTNTDITLGTSGRLSKLNESGEIKEKQLTESGEDWKIESFANEFVLTRKMIVNDDLGAFNNLLSEFGKMAKRTANGIVYDLLQGKGDYANYKMKDGLAIFASGHKNLSSSGAVISEATLTAARTAMMRQTSEKGDALNILPEYLIVAPEQEIAARKIIASTGSTLDNQNAAVVNPFAGSLKIVVDSELEADAWYLAGGTRTIKAGYLAGTGRKPIVQLDTTSLTKTVFQGVFDFGVVAEDYRSLYKNPGE